MAINFVNQTASYIIGVNYIPVLLIYLGVQLTPDHQWCQAIQECPYVHLFQESLVVLVLHQFPSGPPVQSLLSSLSILLHHQAHPVLEADVLIIVTHFIPIPTTDSPWQERQRYPSLKHLT